MIEMSTWAVMLLVVLVGAFCGAIGALAGYDTRKSEEKEETRGKSKTPEEIKARALACGEHSFIGESLKDADTGHLKTRMLRLSAEGQVMDADCPGFVQNQFERDLLRLELKSRGISFTQKWYPR